MKTVPRPIPTLNPRELINHYAEPDAYWKNPVFSDFNTFGFHRLEESRHLTLQSLPPHRKTFHDFFLLTRGSCDRGKGINRHTITQRTLCFIPAHQITYGAATSDDAEGVMCHFDASILNVAQHPLLQSLSFLQHDGFPLVKIPSEHLPFVMQLAERIEQAFHSDLPDKYQRISVYLLALLLEVGRFSRTAQPIAMSMSATITERFKRLVNTHVREKHRVIEYADMLSITPNHLNKCVKQTTNRTAHQWINEMMLLESKVLLSQSSLSIAEIAYRLGLNDQSYFGRFFKKSTGITPSRYRKLIDK